MANFRQFPRLAVSAAGLVATLSAGAAFAGTVNATGYSYGQYDSVNANGIGVGDNPVIATEIDLSTTTGTLATFCTQIFSNIYSQPYTFQNSVLSTSNTYESGSGGASTSNWTQSQINWISALLYNGEVAQTNVNKAALQIAIWEIEYGTPVNGVYNLTSGPGLYYSSDAAVTLAQTYVNDVTGSTPIWNANAGYQVDYLYNATSSNNASYQTLVYLAQSQTGADPNTPAPEPGSITLFGAGLIGLGLLKRLRRA